MNKSSKVLFTILGLSLVLTGCKSKPNTPSGEDSGGDGTIDVGGDIKYGGVSQSGTVGLAYALYDYLENGETKRGYKVVDYIGGETSVEIPSDFNGLPVTGIDNNAFRDNLVIEELKIGKNVTFIGDYAFGRTFNLKSIQVSKQNPFFTVEDGCVYHIEKEGKEVTFKELYFGEAGKYVAYDAVALGVTTLHRGCFGNFENLVYLRVSLDHTRSTSLSRLFNSSHYYSSAETYSTDRMKNNYVPHLESISIAPGAYVKVSNYFAANLYTLTSVTFEEGIQVLDSSAFFNCLRLRDIKIPTSLNTIGQYCFENCYDLRKVYLPTPASGKLTISDYAFRCAKGDEGYNNYRESALFLEGTKINQLNTTESALRNSKEQSSSVMRLNENVSYKTFEEYSYNYPQTPIPVEPEA